MLDAPLGNHCTAIILAIIIGLIIVVAFLGSKVFQRVGIPEVVGLIIIGAVLGLYSLTKNHDHWPVANI